MADAQRRWFGSDAGGRGGLERIGIGAGHCGRVVRIGDFGVGGSGVAGCGVEGDDAGGRSLCGWLHAAASQAYGAASQAQAVASAFESAFAATVHPLAVQANRNTFVQLIRSNFFGFNAPAIMATEAYYEEMWAQDVSAMVGYHGGAAAAAGQLMSGLPSLSGMPSLGGGAMSGLAGLAGAGSAGAGSTGGASQGGATQSNPNVGGGTTGDSNVASGSGGTSNVGGASANIGFPTSSGYIDSGNMSAGGIAGGDPGAGLATAGGTDLGTANLVAQVWRAEPRASGVSGCPRR